MKPLCAVSPNAAMAVCILALCLTGNRTAHGQADINVELDHLQRLNEEGRWVEALEETARLTQGMAKQVRTVGPLSNSYYTFAVLQARFAVRAGDYEAAAAAIKAADAVGSDPSFRRLLASLAPPESDAGEGASQPRRRYEVGVLLRDFALDDARTMLAIGSDSLDEAESAVNGNFQRRRAAGGWNRLVAARDEQSGVALSPQELAALSTFEPSRMAALLYLKKGQVSRARSYLLDAEQAAAAVLKTAFPPTATNDETDKAAPEWPTDGTSPSTAQREAARLRATVKQLRGAVEAAGGNLESAEAAFGEAIDLWQRSYDRDHPDALPAFLGNGKLAIERAEQATQRRDMKTAAARAKKAERLLATAGRLLEAAAVTNSPQHLEWQELSKQASGLTPRDTDVSGLEDAEQAAREALRSLSKYKTTGTPPTTRADPTP